MGRALVRELATEHTLVGVDTVPGPESCSSIQGDLADPSVLRAAFAHGCDAVIHLATVPGGAAELNPRLAKQINVDASMALIDAAAAAGRRPRFIFASSIAVFGDPLPASVDDSTPVAPRLVYGAHKAMLETWIASQSRRAAIDGVSLRLPGIIARPRGPSGMKSAFMSEVFHALKRGERFISPVSPAATMWLMSVRQLGENIRHALTVNPAWWPEQRAITLPALRVTMADLASEIRGACASDPTLLGYAPDAALEAAFGSLPPLQTACADRLGFIHDQSLAQLVRSGLSTLQ